MKKIFSDVHFINRLKNILSDTIESFIDLFGFYKVNRKFSDQSLGKSLFKAFKNYLKPEKIILFYPERPVRSAAVYKLCAMLGYKISSNFYKEGTIPFKYKNDTFFDKKELERISSTNKIINRGNLDISKNYVSEIFQKVFKYNLEVDPISYNGRMVIKSNLNALHKGEVIEGPIDAEDIDDQMVYQKEIDNKNGNGLVLDYRVPVHGNYIPLVYLKYRPVETRFSNTNNFVELEITKKIFSEEEIKEIIEFSKCIGVDYGELDVLRDKDGRIYIVDVNSTPWGPPNGLKLDDQKKALKILSKSFENLICNFQK